MSKRHAATTSQTTKISSFVRSSVLKHNIKKMKIDYSSHYFTILGLDMRAIVLILAALTFNLGQGSEPSPSVENRGLAAPSVSTRNLPELPCKPGVNCWQRDINESQHDHDHHHHHHNHDHDSHTPLRMDGNRSQNNSSDILDFNSFFITYIIVVFYLLTKS